MEQPFLNITVKAVDETASTANEVVKLVNAEKKKLGQQTVFD